MQKTKKNGNESNEIFNIPPYLIKPNPSLARTDFSDTSLVSLADSIRRYGILQPLAVRLSENGKYELVAGERRLRAAVLLGMKTVPCVMICESSDFEYLSVVENIQREKLNMFDEARAIRRLYERNRRDAAGTAKSLSISEDILKRKLGLCCFSRAEMQAILSLGINEKTAAAFLKVPHRLRYYTIKLCAEKRYQYERIAELCCDMASRDDLTPDDLEEFASKYHTHECRAEKEEEKPPVENTRPTVVLRDLRAFEVSLRKICGILENAGCSADIRINGEGSERVYTVTVNMACENG